MALKTGQKHMWGEYVEANFKKLATLKWLSGQDTLAGVSVDAFPGDLLGNDFLVLFLPFC